jgi:hypothetical protein
MEVSIPRDLKVKITYCSLLLPFSVAALKCDAMTLVLQTLGSD